MRYPGIGDSAPITCSMTMLATGLANYLESTAHTGGQEAGKECDQIGMHGGVLCKTPRQELTNLAVEGRNKRRVWLDEKPANLSRHILVTLYFTLQYTHVSKRREELLLPDGYPTCWPPTSEPLSTVYGAYVETLVRKRKVAVPVERSYSNRWLPRWCPRIVASRYLSIWLTD